VWLHYVRRNSSYDTTNSSTNHGFSIFILVTEQMTNFLPKGYKDESSVGGYLKLEEGETRFRITSPLIVGWELWYTNSEGEKKVARVMLDDKTALSEVENPDGTPRFFWAFTAYNYKEKKHQIANITQATVRKPIETYCKNAKWGSPIGTNGYDIIITRTGQGKQTEYAVTVDPKEKLSKEALAEIEAVKINLDALYTGEDPFEDTSNEVKPEDVKVDADKLPFK